MVADIFPAADLVDEREHWLRQAEWLCTDDGIHHGADHLRGQGIEYGIQHGCNDCKEKI